MVFKYPDQGWKLIVNEKFDNKQKLHKFIEFVSNEPYITCAILGDQRQGKDVTICSVFEFMIAYNKLQEFPKKLRFVTLGNMKNPPFVDPNDMYYSFEKIPSGSKNEEVIIYCSELDTFLSQRETQSEQNKSFNVLANTFAQNHQKLFGCCKLASQVDVAFWRNCNCKIFKYITPSKLLVPGLERESMLTELAMIMLPKDRIDKSVSLFDFDNNLLTIRTGMPNWYNLEYSEQYSASYGNKEKALEFASVLLENNTNLFSIKTALAQKFRVQISIQELAEYFNLELSSRKISKYGG